VKTFSEFLEHVDNWMGERPEGTVAHNKIPRSEHDHTDVERHWHHDHTKFKKQSVEVSKIKATQGWHHPGWKPKYSQHSDAPHGVRTADGHVHISDGHHRLLHAIRQGHSHFEMHVKDVHDVKDADR
jgi:hypothetical protein